MVTAGESFKPTPKAIKEHVEKLKRQMKGTSTSRTNGSGSTPKSNATPKGGSKRAAPKTPSSSNKKARRADMSDEDDSEDEQLMDFSTPTIKRERYARASANKSYAESGGGDSDDEELVSSSKAFRAGDHSMDATPRDSHSPAGPQGKSIARSKKDPQKLADVSSDDHDAFALY